MRKLVLPVVILCIFVGLGTLYPDQALACSCAIPPTVKAKYETSTAVFTGTLVRTDGRGGNYFKVDQVWKGKAPDGYVYSGNYGQCGTWFEPGKKYVIYTKYRKGKSNYTEKSETTNMCSGNVLAAYADQEIKELNALAGRERNLFMLVGVFIGMLAAVMLYKVKLSKSK